MRIIEWKISLMLTNEYNLLWKIHNRISINTYFKIYYFCRFLFGTLTFKSKPILPHVINRRNSKAPHDHCRHRHWRHQYTINFVCQHINKAKVLVGRFYIFCTVSVTVLLPLVIHRPAERFNWKQIPALKLIERNILFILLYTKKWINSV